MIVYLSNIKFDNNISTCCFAKNDPVSHLWEDRRVRSLEQLVELMKSFGDRPFQETYDSVVPNSLSMPKRSSYTRQKWLLLNYYSSHAAG